MGQLHGAGVIMQISDKIFIDVSHFLGNDWSVTEDDLGAYSGKIADAAEAMDKLRKDGIGPDGSSVLFPHLPYILEENRLIDEEEKEALLHLGETGKAHDVLISIGIGGSYLGNQVLFDIFCGTYWNERTREERGGYPKVYFAGQNMDPAALTELIGEIRRCASHMHRKPKVLLLIISKSGTTLEPVTSFRMLKELLSPFCDLTEMAITDKEKGWLRADAKAEGLPCFTVPDGIGGRFSVFSQVGLVFAALIGLPVREFLSGARAAEEACRDRDPKRNPALMLAALKYIASDKYGIAAEVTMPYGTALRSVGWWYAQLLGESLGKKYDNEGNAVYNGRIPVSAVGTTDMHSLTQEHQQGGKNKLLQFISVKKPEADLDAFCTEDGHEGRVPMSRMMEAACHANEEALAAEHRMSCHIFLGKMDLSHLGALLYFFCLTIAYEGFLENVNAFDQPGVEDYKKILHGELKEYIMRQEG